MNCLDVPPVLRYGNRSIVTGEEAFMLTLEKFASEKRFIDMEKEYGRDHGDLSTITNAFIRHMVTSNYDLLFENIPFFVSRFPLYQQAIEFKLREIMPPQHPIPMQARNVALFTDGTRVEMGVPEDPILKTMLWNGKDHMHCLQFQNTSTPCGISADLFGPTIGNWHDSHNDRVSNINNRLLAAQVCSQYCCTDTNDMQLAVYLLIVEVPTHLLPTYPHVFTRLVFLTLLLQDTQTRHMSGILAAFQCIEVGICHYICSTVIIISVGCGQLE